MCRTSKMPTKSSDANKIIVRVCRAARRLALHTAAGPDDEHRALARAAARFVVARRRLRRGRDAARRRVDRRGAAPLARVHRGVVLRRRCDRNRVLRQRVSLLPRCAVRAERAPCAAREELFVKTVWTHLVCVHVAANALADGVFLGCLG